MQQYPPDPRSARRAMKYQYRMQRRSARYAYRAARRAYRRQYGWSGGGVIGILFVVFIVLFFSTQHWVWIFGALIALALIAAIFWFLRAGTFMNSQPPLQSQQPYQPMQEAPPPDEPYQPYGQGYQPPQETYQEGGHQYQYPPAASSQQDEVPQARYPEPPMQQQ